MDKQYSENMAKLSSNMDRLTNSISNGFALLRGLLLPQQPMYHPPQHPVYSTPPQTMYHPHSSQCTTLHNNQCTLHCSQCLAGSSSLYLVVVLALRIRPDQPLHSHRGGPVLFLGLSVTDHKPFLLLILTVLHFSALGLGLSVYI